MRRSRSHAAGIASVAPCSRVAYRGRAHDATVNRSKELTTWLQASSDEERRARRAALDRRAPAPARHGRSRALARDRRARRDEPEPLRARRHAARADAPGAPAAAPPGVPAARDAARWRSTTRRSTTCSPTRRTSRRGSRRSKEVALTFDDGPGPTTPALLRYLIANDVPATFFLVGKAIGERPGVVRKQIEAGFALGTHTENHARLASKSVADQSREILSAADRITPITGHAVRLFRPPNGSFDANTLAILRARADAHGAVERRHARLSVRSSKPIVYTALSGARGRLDRAHARRPRRAPEDAQGACAIVARAAAQGLPHCRACPQLLRDDPPPPNQPEPRSLAAERPAVSPRLSDRRARRRRPATARAAREAGDRRGARPCGR